MSAKSLGFSSPTREPGFMTRATTSIRALTGMFMTSTRTLRSSFFYGTDDFGGRVGGMSLTAKAASVSSGFAFANAQYTFSSDISSSDEFYFSTENRLFKLNANGTFAWGYQYYPTQGFGGTVVTDVAVDASTGNVFFVTEGYTPFNTSQVSPLLICLNPSGDVQWSQILGGGTAAGRVSYYGKSVDVASDGVYVSYRNNNATRAVHLCKINKTNGNLIWSRDVTSEDTDSRLAVSPDGSMVYWLVTPASGRRILAFNGSGTFQWGRTASVGLTVEYGGMIADATGVFIYQSAQAGDARLLKINTVGDLIFSRLLSDTLSGNTMISRRAQLRGDKINFTFAAKRSGFSLPTDGSGMGTYTVGGSSITYSNSAATLSSVTETISSNGASITSPTMTRFAMTTSAMTPVPTFSTVDTL
jgi:hypothetical protein